VSEGGEDVFEFCQGAAVTRRGVAARRFFINPQALDHLRGPCKMGFASGARKRRQRRQAAIKLGRKLLVTGAAVFFALIVVSIVLGATTLMPAFVSKPGQRFSPLVASAQGVFRKRNRIQQINRLRVESECRPIEIRRAPGFKTCAAQKPMAAQTEQPQQGDDGRVFGHRKRPIKRDRNRAFAEDSFNMVRIK
jgi:hypothetical protein